MLFTVYLFILIELTCIGYFDIVTKKILNPWAILNCIFFIGFLFAYPEYYSLSFKQLYYPIIFLFVGLLFYSLKIMGGGDSKLLFSIYLLIPNNIHEKAFLNLAYCTIMVAGSLFITNLIINRKSLVQAYQLRDVSIIKKNFGRKFSFAPVIWLSWVKLGWDLRNRFF